MTAIPLKIIAMLAMLCDHCDYLFRLPRWAWYVGRLAFPLYALMLADSWRHLKKNPARLKKYILSLAALALVSEFAYDLAFSGNLFFWGSQNQILQFLTFVLAAAAAEKINSRILRIVLWAAVTALNQFCLMGYLALGIITLLFMRWYLDRFEKWSFGKRLLGSSLVMGAYWVGSVLQEMTMYPDMYSYNGVLSRSAVLGGLRMYSVTLLLIPVIALYNGQYGNPPKWFRIVYRYFYPAHLLILALITSLINR